MLQEMTSLVLCVAGDDTPVEYISESLYRLTQEQQALIEKDIAQGGPGTAPDLSVLFAKHYPEACAPVSAGTSITPHRLLVPHP